MSPWPEPSSERWPEPSPVDAPGLRETQRAFLGDVSGLAPLEARAAALLFGAPPAGTLDDRRHVYAHGYLARLIDALAQDFGALLRVLGGRAFDSLCARYVRACPPRTFDLAHAGSRLPVYLESDPLTADLPFLPDLARLERAIAVAFVARDAVPLDLSTVAADPAGLAEIPLALVPGTQVLRSRWPLAALWNTRFVDDDAAVAVPLGDGREHVVLVVRRGTVVRCEPLDDAAARLASLIAAAGALDLESAAARGILEPIALARAFGALAARGALCIRDGHRLLGDRHAVAGTATPSPRSR